MEPYIVPGIKPYVPKPESERQLERAQDMADDPARAILAGALAALQRRGASNLRLPYISALVVALTTDIPKLVFSAIHTALVAEDVARKAKS